MSKKFERHFTALFKLSFYIVYPSKMQEYVLEIPKEKVILTMIVLKRFDDILAPTLPKKPLLKRLKDFKHKV